MTWHVTWQWVKVDSAQTTAWRHFRGKTRQLAEALHEVTRREISYSRSATFLSPRESLARRGYTLGRELPPLFTALHPSKPRYAVRRESAGWLDTRKAILFFLPSHAASDDSENQRSSRQKNFLQAFFVPLTCVRFLFIPCRPPLCRSWRSRASPKASPELAPSRTRKGCSCSSTRGTCLSPRAS